MPSTNIPVKSHVARGGTALGAAVVADPTNGNNFLNDGNTRLFVEGVATAYPLTVITPATVDGLAVADLGPRTIAINERVIMGPFPRAVYGDTVEITHGAASTVKLTPFNSTVR